MPAVVACPPARRALSSVVRGRAARTPRPSAVCSGTRSSCRFVRRRPARLARTVRVPVATLAGEVFRGAVACRRRFPAGRPRHPGDARRIVLARASVPRPSRPTPSRMAAEAVGLDDADPRPRRPRWRAGGRRSITTTRSPSSGSRPTVRRTAEDRARVCAAAGTRVHDRAWAHRGRAGRAQSSGAKTSAGRNRGSMTRTQRDAEDALRAAWPARLAGGARSRRSAHAPRHARPAPSRRR